MSVYDHRDKSAYGGFDHLYDKYADNEYILHWWTKRHDEALARLISKWKWVWSWKAREEIESITDPQVLTHWAHTDPACNERASYNVLMWFCIGRAGRIGLTKNIPEPKWKKCALCAQDFVEDSMPMPLIERFGIETLDSCAPCLRDCVLQGSGSQTATREDILNYMRALTEALGIIPPHNFGEQTTDWQDMDNPERVKILRVLQGKPSTLRIKTVLGSWIQALIEAGIVDSLTTRNSRGYVTKAKDGHMCFSLGEKSIDDFLNRHGIKHGKEPLYPEGNHRADFLVGNTLIEYVGLIGNSDYRENIKRKEAICKKHKVPLVLVEPRDLISRSRLEKKLLALNQAL